MRLFLSLLSLTSDKKKGSERFLPILSLFDQHALIRKLYSNTLSLLTIMSGFSILDRVVGRIFIYFLLSIIGSSAAELWFTSACLACAQKKSKRCCRKMLKYDK